MVKKVKGKQGAAIFNNIRATPSGSARLRSAISNILLLPSPGVMAWPGCLALQPITGQAGPVWTNQSRGAHLTLSDWRP